MAAGMMEPTERRRAPRVAERLPVAITEAGAQLTAETQNLSTSGAYCSMDRFIAPMTKLELTLDVPDGASYTKVQCQGVVVRVEPAIGTPDHGRYHVAIFFTELSQRGRSAIARFVQQRLSGRPST